MRKLVATEYLSLDGVFEEPGEWSRKWFNDEAGQFKFAELLASDMQLLGRLTYEGFARAWPTMEGTGEFGEKMNGMPKYVVSSTLTEPTWNNTTVISGNVLEEVRRLKDSGGGDILVAGSGQLVRHLMVHGLIDEYRFLVHPVVLGHGKRLFTGEEMAELQLVEARSFTSGLVLLTYLPVPAA
jgi:dihydrofolate reductase